MIVSKCVLTQKDRLSAVVIQASYLEMTKGHVIVSLNGIIRYYPILLCSELVGKQNPVLSQQKN